MGDMGDYFRDLAKFKQEKRADNRESGPALLGREGIPFVSKNGGAHLIVAGRFDFWPGTGLWMLRGTKARHRGVLKLIKRIKDEAK